MGVLCLEDSQMDKHKITDFKWETSDNPVNVQITLNFREDYILLEIKGKRLQIRNLNLSIDNGYRISLLPSLSSRPDNNIPAVLDLTNL